MRAVQEGVDLEYLRKSWEDRVDGLQSATGTALVYEVSPGSGRRGKDRDIFFTCEAALLDHIELGETDFSPAQ